MEIKLYSETGSARETVTHLTTRLWDGMGWTDGRTYAAPDTSGPQEREAKLSGKGRVGYNNVITGRINYGANYVRDPRLQVTCLLLVATRHSGSKDCESLSHPPPEPRIGYEEAAGWAREGGASRRRRKRK